MPTTSTPARTNEVAAAEITALAAGAGPPANKIAIRLKSDCAMLVERVLATAILVVVKVQFGIFIAPFEIGQFAASRFKRDLF